MFFKACCSIMPKLPNVIIRNVIMLNVVMQNVVAPKGQIILSPFLTAPRHSA